MWHTPLIGPDFTATHAEHGEIIDALRVGSARRPEGGVQANWESSASRLAPVIDEIDASMRPSVGPIAVSRAGEARRSFITRDAGRIG
ncbi:hypothetical protein J421_5764 (plasmid) [Gemmatirosa kalamazoonensis]|uniref:Uncharacterized protein n=1 Tax=Gemmatirosa kalamazoonensis TaxID=861299 RepID=W0RQP5_9BACT|nr:hypothetical protein J421_5764 [Gemmatirosa kalamazoonensis]